VRHNATPIVSAARLIDRTDPRVEIVLVSDPFSAAEREIEFMAKGHRVTQIDEQALVESEASLLGNAVVIVTPNHPRALDVLRQRYPNAAVELVQGENGEQQFYVIRVGATGGASEATVPPSTALSPLPGGVEQFPAEGSRFIGNLRSSVWDIDVGTVDVTNGQLTVRVAPVPGYGAVVDSLWLVAPDGREVRFEAEDPAVTSGDPAYASREGADGHWWLQSFGPFSGGAGLVAQADEGAPALTLVAAVPDGRYRLHVGSFTGDPNNGVFALDVVVETNP
jgi:hypothetical protein